MTDLQARVQRLEELLGVDAPADDGAQRPRTQPFLERPRPGREFGDFMKSQYQPGQVFVAVGVKTDRGSWNSSVRRSATKPLKRKELGSAAALCQALSSEARLAILNELTLADRTTAELMEAAGIDRGQLYHHLRDLFVQGLVEQPERGRYAVTPRGRIAFLVTSVLPSAGDPADRARALDLGEVAGGETKPDGAERGD